MADPEYFTLAEFRALPDMDDATQYPDDRVLAAAAYITSVIEREVGTSFVARSITKAVDGTGHNSLLLPDPYVQSVTSVTVNGSSWPTTGLLFAGGVLQWGTGYGAAWSYGVGNVSVTYVSGYSTTPPADIKEAALRGTRAYLLETSSRAGVTDRRSSITNEQGTVSYVIAGRDNPTGYPMVDAVILGWRARLKVFGFA